MIKACIIDDEEKSRQTLKQLVEQYCNGVLVVSEDKDVESAYHSITKHNPDMIFLDIAMPGGSGFDLLKKFSKIDFDVIFVTAYDHYALQAIKISALDYLLKPINIDELIAATEKVGQKQALRNISTHINLLLGNLITKNTNKNKIAIPSNNGFEFVHLEDIIRIDADGSYTRLVLNNGSKILTSYHLNEYEELLPKDTFFRSHHSHIINLGHIKKYFKGDGGHVVMSDNSTVDIAKRKKKEFLERFNVV